MRVKKIHSCTRLQNNIMKRSLIILCLFYMSILVIHGQSHRFTDVGMSDDGISYVATSGSVEIKVLGNGLYSILTDIPPEKPSVFIVSFDSKEITDGLESFHYLVEGSQLHGDLRKIGFFTIKTDLSDLAKGESGILTVIYIGPSGPLPPIFFILNENEVSNQAQKTSPKSIEEKEYYAPNEVEPGESNIEFEDGKMTLGGNVTNPENNNNSKQVNQTANNSHERTKQDPNRTEYLEKIKDGRLDRNTPVKTIENRNTYKEEGSQGTSLNLLKEIELYFSLKEIK